MFLRFTFLACIVGALSIAEASTVLGSYKPCTVEKNGPGSPVGTFVSELAKAGSGQGIDAKLKRADAAVQSISRTFLLRGMTKQMREAICSLSTLREASSGAAANEVSATLQYLFASSLTLDYERGVNQSDGINSPSSILKSRLAQLNQIADALDLARDGLFAQRREYDADSYRYLRASIVAQRARVEMYKGDAGYRLAGASLVTSVVGSSEPPVVAPYYGSARQLLFEALLLDPDNVQSKLLADDIESRLRWLREGRSFGGGRFFEVEPVMGVVQRYCLAFWLAFSRNG